MSNNNNLMRKRSAWQTRGQSRPAGAVTPGPGQESVWDYPRPPALVADTRLVQVKLDGVLVAETRAALRLLETASPPTFYLPPDDVRSRYLSADSGTSFCEWKGRATYHKVCVAAHCVAQAAWSYPQPYDNYGAIRDYLAFYPARVACYVDGERVRPQAGDLYGGWITGEIVGPFKGEAGTAGW